MGTEARNPRSYGLDQMTSREIVRLMNEEELAVFRALQSAEESLAVAVDHAAEAIRRGGRVVYAGAGTSGRIATMDAAEMPPTFSIESDRFVCILAGGNSAGEKAQEDAEDDGHLAVEALNAIGLNPNDILIGIAASGTTPFVLTAVRHSRQKGVWTCGIANNRNAPLLGEADHPVLLETGPEVLTGSTRLKAGTAQKLALNRISTGAMVLNGKVVENLMVDVNPKNQKLRDRCVRIVCELAPLTQDEARTMLSRHEWSPRRVLEALRTEERVAATPF
jgi:N-acetylmuramic acid 6-phosphate etherase